MAIRKQRVQKDPEEVRERILRVFSERARRGGIRSVVMAELATELRMSASTLYNHFASKQDLVTALVERWAEDFGASGAAIAELASERTPVERMVHWAEEWAKNVSRYAPAFWEDLRRDHPEGWRIFRREIRRSKEAGAAVLRPHLRSDLHPDVALAVLELIQTHVSDPRFSEQCGTGRRQTIETAIRIWARGALDSPGKLTAIAPRGPRSHKGGTRGGR